MLFRSFSSVNYKGNPDQQGYGKGEEIRLTPGGEIELRVNQTFPMYAIRARTQGAGIRRSQWHHVLAVFGKGELASQIQIYVDGRELPLQVDFDGFYNGRAALKADFVLGSEATPGAPAFRGAIDELRIYFDTAPTSAQAAALFASQAKIGRAHV